MANAAPEAAWTSIEDLFDRTLGSRPSAPHLALIKKAENERPEVKEFLDRACRLMAIAKASPANMTPIARLDPGRHDPRAASRGLGKCRSPIHP